jgi:hypothetical protein
MTRNWFYALLMMLVSRSIFPNTLYFPQVAYGGGYTTTIVIMNMGTTVVSSPITFYNQNGGILSTSGIITIPVGGSARYTLPDTGPVKVGWGEFAAGVGTVRGVATFDLRSSSGTLLTTVGVLGLEGANTFTIPVEVTPTSDTGVALANVKSGSSIKVGLRLLGEDGSQAGAASDARLVSRGQMADFVTGMFPQLSGKSFKGSLVVEAAPGESINSLAATALVLKEGIYSALPVLSDPAPVFQSDSIRASVGQLAVASDNSHLSLSITIENTSSAPLYLALVSYSGGFSDNVATRWAEAEVIEGIRKIDSSYSSSNAKQADFTTIAPSERITVVINAYRLSSGTTPGTTFSFSVEGAYYTSTGLQSVSIGFPVISVGQQRVPGASSNTPVFQSDWIRATVGQIGVAADNSYAAVSITIENTSSSRLYLALVSGNCGLSDDIGTNWSSCDSISGIKTVYTSYSYATGKQADFTGIAPLERITVVINHHRNVGANKPGSIFSFSVQGTYYTSSGLKNVSIGLPGIKAVTQ